MPLQQLSKILNERGHEIVRDLKKKAAGEPVYTHVPTGIGPIDKTFGGLERQVATLLMGHSGDGKTTLMQQFARGAAHAGIASVSFYMEDPKRRLADRVFAQLTGTASHRIGRLDSELGDDFPDKLRAATEKAEWSKLCAVWTGDAEPGQVLDIIEKTTTVNGVPVGLVQVDYLQRFSDTEDGLESIIANFAKRMGKVAEERELAVVLGSQVKTKVLERGRQQYSKQADVRGFRPGKGDAMWSARVEQFCRTEMAWWREGRWKRECGEATAKDDRGELVVVKANYGPECPVFLGYDGPRARIYELGG